MNDIIDYQKKMKQISETELKPIFLQLTAVVSQQVPIQDFKNVCPKQQIHDICQYRFTTNSLQILIPTTFKSVLCYKYNLHFSYVMKDGLLGKYLVITPKKSKLKILHRNFCLPKEVFWKLPVQRKGRTGPG